MPLREIVGALDPDLPVAVLVVMHLRSARPSTLTEQLARTSQMPVVTARDGDRLVAGTIYVCPPDRHLAVELGRVRVLFGAAENGHRPAIDVLFRSLATAADGRSVAVVVSGALDDGAAGALAIADNGGAVVVQDPDEAVVASMPEHVLAVAPGTTCLPAARIAPWISDHVRTDERAETKDPQWLDFTAGNGGGKHASPSDQPQGFACPDCGGVLVLSDEDRLLWFQCRVGHRWSASALRERQEGALEDALWAALRIVDEQLDLDRRLLDRARATAHPRVAERLVQRVRERTDAADTLRRVLQTVVLPQAATAGDALAAVDDPATVDPGGHSARGQIGADGEGDEVAHRVGEVRGELGEHAGE